MHNYYETSQYRYLILVFTGMPVTNKPLKGKATLKETIIKMKDILFPNILVQIS